MIKLIISLAHIVNASFSLLESGDEMKRLYVSVWVHDRASRNELIGCMSFMVEDILKSDVVSDVCCKMCKNTCYIYSVVVWSASVNVYIQIT